jgi:hypothetical protein
MQAIELETEIDQNHELHLKLPDDVRAGKAKVVVLCEQPEAQAEAEQPQERKPVNLGQFRGQIWMSDDFDDPLPDEFWLGGHP